MGLLTSTSLDNAALDEILSGKASIKLAELTAYAQQTPCFHTHLTTYGKVVAAISAAVRKIDTAAPVTKVIDLSPVTSRGTAASGWKVVDESARQLVDCGYASPSARSADVLSCSPSSAGADTCWVAPEGFVLCIRDPWQKQLALIPRHEHRDLGRRAGQPVSPPGAHPHRRFPLQAAHRRSLARATRG